MVKNKKKTLVRFLFCKKKTRSSGFFFVKKQTKKTLVRFFFILIPGLRRRVIDIFDDDGNGEVDFKEFIMGLSHFRFEKTFTLLQIVISVPRAIWRVNLGLRSG